MKKNVDRIWLKVLVHIEHAVHKYRDILVGIGLGILIEVNCVLAHRRFDEVDEVAVAAGYIRKL